MTSTASPRTREKNVRTQTGSGLVPFITQRKGEDAAPDNLIIERLPSGPQLYYADEDPRDRPMKGILWARCSFNPVDDRRMPTGEPQWKFIHPYRQMITMARLHCQVCAEPARTPLGFIFLAGPRDHDPASPLIITNQPPVCAKHLRASAALCDHLERDPMVFLAQSAPLYGVDGVVYGVDRDNRAEAVAWPKDPLRFNDPRIGTVLASQLIRRLGSFRVVDMHELLQELAAA
ncbi:hypothetical protein [Streptomyces fungicidicus]|uniref:hypothetical protein n=1 Tax=Streptomyces fungicidicus TaxID=68203 RepID=UPI003326033C